MEPICQVGDCSSNILYACFAHYEAAHHQERRKVISDARLIAALSDLLVVAKGVIADGALSDEHDPGGQSGPSVELLTMARAAIAKAEREAR